MEKYIIVNSQNLVNIEDIALLDNIRNNMQFFHSETLNKDLEIVFFCINHNDEFNAFGSQLSGKKILGDVVVFAKRGQNDVRGFEYLTEMGEYGEEDIFCECLTVQNILKLYIRRSLSNLKEMKERFG